jgi:hypothetical protein
MFEINKRGFTHMAKQLLSQTGNVGAGSIQSFPSTDSIRTVQFNPAVGSGFSGSMLIEGSYAANPGNNDFQTLVSLTFTGATSNFSLDIASNAPWIRARIVTSTSGAVSVSADSRTGTISGSQGSLPATILIDSALKCAGTGTGFLINAPVVPSITSDDVFMSSNISETLTDALEDLQPIIGTGAITASEADLNLLAGKASAGLEAADFTKLAAITASATDINKLNGLSTTATELGKLSGFTGNTADLNAIAGLDDAGVSVTELAHLAGLTTDVQTALNALPSLVGLNSTVDDLNLVYGAAAGTGDFASSGALTSTHLSYLVGVSSNIQTQLDARRLESDTIGISEITSAAISITELNYLSGVTSNVQDQLDDLAFDGTYASGTFSGPLFAANGTVSAPGIGFASAHTTGFYLNGSAISAAVSGTKVATLSASTFVLGDGSTSGGPTIRSTGFGVANPVYSFTGDTSTGLYRVSTNKIGIAGNGKALATFDGSTTPGAVVLGTASDNTAVSVAGVFSGEKLLAKVSVSAGKNPAAAIGAGNETDLYTVPTGRTAIVTRVAVILTTATQGGSGGAINQFRMDLGDKDATCKELLDNVTNTTVFNPGGSYAFDTAGQIMWLGVGDNAWNSISGSDGNAYAVFGAGTVIAARPQARADFDVWTVSVAVFGYEY